MQAHADNSYDFVAGTFDGAENLESIEFDSISNSPAPLNVGPNAFRNLTKLKNIKIHIVREGAEYGGTIYKNAFNGLPAIESIDFQTQCLDHYDLGNINWWVEQGAFDGVDSRKVYLNPSCVKRAN